MVIQILTNIYDEGYLGKDSPDILAPFFSGGNVAFRRKVFEDIGTYDTKCRTGEDIDICLRAYKTKWELYFRPKAVVRHKNRSTFKGMAEQWIGYGLYHPYVYKKHCAKAVELFVPDKNNPRSKFTCLFYLPSPLSVVIFLTSFLLFHLSIIFYFIASSFLNGYAAYAALLACAVFGARYFSADNYGLGIRRNIEFAFLRYIINWIIVISNLAGGIKNGMIYVYGTHRT